MSTVPDDLPEARPAALLRPAGRSRPARVLFDGPERVWEAYRDTLPRALAEAGVLATVSRDLSPEETDWIVYAPGGRITDFSPYRQARAVLSLWAGVELIVVNPTLTQPLARMVDPGLTQGMVEWVTGHVLRHHLGLDRHIRRTEPRWEPSPPPLATERPVTVLGLGELGLACALALTGLGFPVTGWARSPKDERRLARVFTGRDGLAPALTGAEIVVLLTPLTRLTENLMDAERLRLPRRGFVLLNPGRGALIDDAALLAALDEGQVGHATLDTFRQEPLPPDHPFWSHPRVTVTPHIAAETRPETAARAIAENIRRGQAGEPLLHLVDRRAGY
ncbi:NAD(P)-dependent oxidoreductase [Rubellimicrobium sp. CFH 75288]|uniref:NAD(P)-dependent oxidoreductase n=1 Tax=Rubellimicrobium sp. CFH 75288 TaxID=2697034 RepID=UPI0014128762|nr:NAD(P)-dependent oxidoreductase [Rubellimicrobium sp. CFH 75288]NAZ37087.1 glyoxylate/hydroxypyruvate reductase A [Rubellimicrobium sp. CFH 75288]